MMLKSILLISMFISTTVFASGRIEMVCGQVTKARSAKLLKRLEPSFFGLNPKYILMTKFNDPIGFSEEHSKDTYSSVSYTSEDLEKVYTGFSWKNKFKVLKSSVRSALKSASKAQENLYACVGTIQAVFKYSGTEVFYSTDSLEAAKEKMRHQLRRHL